MLKPPKIKFQYLQEESYLAFIKNSVGAKSYQSFYINKAGRPHDILGRGDLSCAYFVSTILYLFGQVKKPSFTVARTAEKMLAAGAKQVSVNKLKPGDVLVWMPRQEKTGPHNHIGFYIGNNQAVSNSDKTRAIAKHHFQFKGKRKIEMAIRPNWRRINAKS